MCSHNHAQDIITRAIRERIADPTAEIELRDLVHQPTASGTITWATYSARFELQTFAVHGAVRLRHWPTGDQSLAFFDLA